MLKVKFRFRAGHRDDYSTARPWQLRSLFLNLTEHCQLRCGYCHAHVELPSASMPFDVVERVLDEAVATGSPTILLTGGEPLLYPRFADVLAGCQARQLTVKIATNGALIDEDQLEQLLRHGVRSLQVSLDTLDPRLYAAIKGVDPSVHGRVVSNLRRCVASGRLHLAASAVAHRAVVAGLPALMQFCRDLGLDTFTLYHLIPFGRAAGAATDWLSEQEFVATVGGLIARYAELPGYQAVDLCVPWSRQSALLQLWSPRLDIKPIGCIAGKTSMTILVDGEGVPCVCLEDRGHSCGNIRNQPLRELWQAPAMRYYRGEAPIATCAGCSAFDFCLGGCRALAFLTSSRPDGPDPACRHWLCGAEESADARR